MNSGLHDGIYWKNLRRFIQEADYAAAFWSEILEGLRRRGLAMPEVIYRTTVATDGYARSMGFNPNKMVAFNGVVLDKLRMYNVISRVIDDFDMTFPWHYDNRANDGVHYGRAPPKMKWRDGQIGHLMPYAQDNNIPIQCCEDGCCYSAAMLQNFKSFGWFAAIAKLE